MAEYDDYHLPGNVKPFGFKSDLKDRRFNNTHSRVLSEDLDWDADLEYGNNVDIISESSPALMAPSPGEPSQAYAAASRESVSSFTKLTGHLNFSMTNNVDEVNAIAQRSRSGTASSLMASETAYDPVSQQMAETPEADITDPKRARAASYISVTGAGSDRRVSYNHTRDTSYEEYLQQQKHKRRTSQRLSQGSNSSFSSSLSSAGSSTPPTTVPASRVPSDSAAAYRLSLNLKNEVDDALSAQFGWGTASRSSSMDSEMASGQPPAIAVSGGAVKQPKSVRDSLVRAPSDGSEMGMFENVSDAPEDNNADDDMDRKRENRDDATRALLGGNEKRDHVEHPELLRPGRPKSEAIAFVVTPPPKSPEPGAGSRMTWGSAYSPN